jgi:hypothetical protein
MTQAGRPYSSFSIEDLEALFAAQGHDVLILSQLVEELSPRKTKRARRLLSLAAKTLSEVEPEGDESPESNASYDSETLEGEDWGPPRHQTALNNGPVDEGRSRENIPDLEQPPDDRRRPQRLSLIRPVGTPGLPAPWIRTLDASGPLSVAADADLPQIYVAALAALIVEIKKTGAGQKRYELENGVRAEGKEPIYEFPFTDAADLFEDAKVEVEIFGRRIDGSIVSINSGRLWLATGEDLGRILKHVVLLVDATALLEALKQRLEDACKGELRHDALCCGAARRESH